MKKTLRHMSLTNRPIDGFVVRASELLNDEEVERLVSLTQYAFKQLNGEDPELDKVTRNGTYTYLYMTWDSTKAHRSDGWIFHVDKVSDDLSAYVEDGTPIYKTNRVGKRGERAIESLVDLDYDRLRILTVDLWIEQEPVKHVDTYLLLENELGMTIQKILISEQYPISDVAKVRLVESVSYDGIECRDETKITQFNK